MGTPAQELEAFFIGNAPALISHEPMYESAWRDRCRLVTAAAGVVALELFVATRFMKKHGIDK
jgi:hypothetical protein